MIRRLRPTRQPRSRIRRPRASRKSTTITARVSRIRIAGSSRSTTRRPSVDQRGERARAAVSRRDPGARGDQEAHDGAVELRALRAARAPRRSLFLSAQRRPAEPERAVRGGWPARAAARAARSEHAEQGRDDRTRRDRAEPGRQGARIQPVGRRERLAHLAFPRRRDRHRPAGRAALHQVRDRSVDRRFAHGLLRALSAARGRLR